MTELKITTINAPLTAPKSILLCLPGRGSDATQITVGYQEKLKDYGIKDTLFLGLHREWNRWYPMPNGPNDQADALVGLQESVDLIKVKILELSAKYNLPLKKIGLVGFSAGAVVSLQVVTQMEEPLAVVLSCSGAILDPAAVPEAKNDTLIWLCHNQDDSVFGWAERYQPTVEALKTKGYKVKPFTKFTGGHVFNVKETAPFLVGPLV